MCAPPPPPRNAQELEQLVRKELAKDGIDYDLLLNPPKVLTLWRDREGLRTLPEPDQAEMERIDAELARELRNVMKTGLRRVFEVQAVALGLVGGALAFNVTNDIPLVGQALGFWMIWLFTIPSLRARKGMRTFEKSALNIAFLAMPLANVGLTAITRQSGIIWSADVALLLVLYLFYGVRSVSTQDEVQQGKVTGVLRYLDWGSWR